MWRRQRADDRAVDRAAKKMLRAAGDSRCAGGGAGAWSSCARGRPPDLQRRAMRRRWGCEDASVSLAPRCSGLGLDPRGGLMLQEARGLGPRAPMELQASRPPSVGPATGRRPAAAGAELGRWWDGDLIRCWLCRAGPGRGAGAAEGGCACRGAAACHAGRGGRRRTGAVAGPLPGSPRRRRPAAAGRSGDVWWATSMALGAGRGGLGVVEGAGRCAWRLCARGGRRAGSSSGRAGGGSVWESWGRRASGT